MHEGDHVGPYDVAARLGAGGMGEVWRAEDTRIGREVALKLLPEDFADDAERQARFEREARTLASLNHHNIATLYGLEHLDGKHVLVMELVEGEGLDEVIARGPLPVDEAAAIALQIAAALEAAHEAGIVHRDLKPANVRIRPDGTVKVLDFGLAKVWEADEATSGLTHSPTITSLHTRAGVLLGTAAYMAPEQARGKRVDRRTDIWAFGVVLWEMLTGRRMFDGETVTDVIAAVVTRDPDWVALPPATPAAVRRILGRCLRRDPRTRQPDIASVRLDLEELGGGEDEAEESSRVAASPRTTTPVRRPRLAWAAIALVAMLTGGALASLLQPRPPPPPVVEFEVTPPPETRFYLDPERPGAATVSPDGGAIAFTAEAKGKYQLYIRQLDSAAGRAVPGTEGAQYPFWSPDSRWVGFFDGSRIKKVQAIGGVGSPVTICEVQEMKGASWGSSGFIVFAPSAGDVLERVSDAGGTPAPVTVFGHELNEDSHRHPRFLPDGRHFLYLARVNSGTPENGVMVGSLDGGPGKLLLRSPAAAEYASGYLLFLRDAALMAQPFDPGRLELTGEAVPVADGIRVVSMGTAQAVFTASDNGVLAYQIGDIAAARQLVWHDREGRVMGPLGDAATYWDVAVAPGGRETAVTISEGSRGAGSADVWTYDLRRGVRTRLTFDPHDESGLVWSPDGRTLVFSSNREGPYDLYAITVGGTQPERLLYASDGAKFPCSISPDGRFLLFAEDHERTGIDLMLLPLEGEPKPRPFITSDFNQPHGVFSPDGRWVAYASNESGHMEVYVTPFPGPGRKWQISTQGGSWPQWRDDGRELYYRAPVGTIFRVSVETRGESLLVGTPQSLEFAVTTDGSSARYSAAADGSRFLSIDPVTSEVQPPLTVVLNWTARLSR